MSNDSLQFFESSYQTSGYERPDLQPIAGGGPAMTFMNAASGPLNIEDAPPLLEELGIDFGHIKRQTLSILTVGIANLGGKGGARGAADEELVHADLTGPLLYCMLFGFLLLLSGNNHFGYVYGFGAVGSVGIFGLLNLMHPQGIALYQ